MPSRLPRHPQEYRRRQQLDKQPTAPENPSFMSQRTYDINKKHLKCVLWNVQGSVNKLCNNKCN
ncbi:hypothetical protein DPMN_045624 [Dreissena polymorpha]|uniref:Uncharacterized protein n=1 Tax=Dreissena polymorpha TaxID=45954 RepID=A0A9D4D6I0_DREPO|nr:hypothetical protein DPMN_045624 [Dreissena polymorpha]